MAASKRLRELREETMKTPWIENCQGVNGYYPAWRLSAIILPFIAEVVEAAEKAHLYNAPNTRIGVALLNLDKALEEYR